jgi:hypothetical protein
MHLLDNLITTAVAYVRVTVKACRFSAASMNGPRPLRCAP